MAFYRDTVWLGADEANRQVRNIFCVGRNYRDHASELGNAVPTEPMLFGKWTHAMVSTNEGIVLPGGRTNVHHELEIVLWMKEAYRPGITLRDAVGGVALGLDLTDRDAQNRLKAAGQPWEYAKSFRASGVVTDFYEVTDWDALQQSHFSLQINGRVVQEGTPLDMVFSFETLANYIGETYGYGANDMIFTGTPAGVGPLQTGDKVELWMGSSIWGSCSVQ